MQSFVHYLSQWFLFTIFIISCSSLLPNNCAYYRALFVCRLLDLPWFLLFVLPQVQLLLFSQIYRYVLFFFKVLSPWSHAPQGLPKVHVPLLQVLYHCDWRSIRGIYASLLLIVYYFIGKTTIFLCKTQV